MNCRSLKAFLLKFWTLKLEKMASLQFWVEFVNNSSLAFGGAVTLCRDEAGGGGGWCGSFVPVLQLCGGGGDDVIGSRI